jgi:hypothetical protein
MGAYVLLVGENGICGSQYAPRLSTECQLSRLHSDKFTPHSQPVEVNLHNEILGNSDPAVLSYPPPWYLDEIFCHSPHIL